jgi:hypothetical protein
MMEYIQIDNTITATCHIARVNLEPRVDDRDPCRVTVFFTKESGLPTEELEGDQAQQVWSWFQSRTSFPPEHRVRARP